MQNDDPEYSIARCQILVRDAQRTLETAGKWSLSDGLLDVLNRLPQLSSRFRRKDQDVKDLRQKLTVEHQSRLDTQQREQALLEKVKLQEDTIKKQLATLRALNNDLQAAKVDAKRQYEKGFKTGQEAEKNRQNQPDSDFEDLIRRQLVRGTEKFNAYDFAGALTLLKEAQNSILSLPAARRPLFDNTKLRYQMAISGAYVNDLAASERSLSSFVQATFSNASSREEMLNLAHAQHLLAQVYIGQDNVQDAQNTCKHSNEIRWQYLQSTDNRRYQSAALSARLVELQGQRGASLLREAIRDPAVRDVLKEAYSKLKPLQAGGNPRNEPYILSEPATELLPIWTMKTQAKQPVNNPPKADGKDKAKPQAPPTVPQAKLTEWLNALDLRSHDNEFLDRSLEQAIRSSDVQKVSQILSSSPPIRPVAPALHIAALANDLQTATLLLAHDPSLAKISCTAKSAAGKNLHGVLPMHLAVGAQHAQMIRLLHSHGADLLAVSDKKHKNSAPPLWLVSERWLSWTGKDKVEEVVGILELLRGLGWRKGDRINREGWRMGDLVVRNLESRKALKRGLLGYLDSIPQ
ncbi:hypothetical protein M409DRAFT_18867 [Zasmidium cellare ATCC 36951]|uniref:Uncharacterized protein n=1 Tax=Zasmidium cellare ATCC 36951 TaxID=1080233 RepID=A0A6A6CV26_ZASCE|nr:uncharacterized protein M409DRAFT_18867 [Zasmidium cellare ATCC 36951]KAF2170895.1 hypothetical protein M409DRAFT_18867 [Zasmidium cellare ATCC 36951]